MARLRYNGLKAVLGGALTSSGLTITFAAALTHSNGTAVPTIVAPDYIPLTILDSSGNLQEIVWLTAYTAGATTGTIVRGREGTPGTAAASGLAVRHGPTKRDLVGAAYVATSASAFGSSGNAAIVLPTVQDGDLVVIMGAGAYGSLGVVDQSFSMKYFSNENYINAMVAAKVCTSADSGITVTFTLTGSENWLLYAVVVRDWSSLRSASSALRVFNAYPVAVTGYEAPGDLILWCGAVRLNSVSTSFPHGTLVARRTADNISSALYQEQSSGVTPGNTFSHQSGNAAVASAVVIG